MNAGHVLRRLLGAIPLLFGISLILFAVIHLAPGGPLDVYADNPSVSPEALEEIKQAYGLDRPVPTLPMFHPSFLLRTPERKREAWRDLLSLRARLDELLQNEPEK